MNQIEMDKIFNLADDVIDFLKSIKVTDSDYQKVIFYSLIRILLAYSSQERVLVLGDVKKAVKHLEKETQLWERG